MLSCVAAEKVLEGEIRLGPVERGEFIILQSMGLQLDTRPRIVVTFPEGNGETSLVFKQECELVKDNFDGNVEDEMRGVGRQDCRWDTR